MTSKALKNVRKLNQQVVYLSEYMTAAQWADYKARTLTLDLTACIQNAINALTSGGVVEMGTGTAKITSAITSTVAGVKLKGNGRAATIISVTGSGYDALSFTGYYSGVYDLGLTSPSIRTSGAGVSFDVVFGCEAINLNLFNQFKAIYTGLTYVMFLDRIYIRNCAATTGGGIHINGGGDQFLSNILMDNDSTQPGYGLWLQKTGGAWVTTSDFIRSGTGVKLQPGAAEEVIWCFFDRVACDTCSLHGWLIDAQATSTVKGCDFVQCWASSASFNGVRLQGAGVVDGMEFQNMRAISNGEDGLIAATTGVVNTKVIGGTFTGNSATTPHTHAGIDMGVDVSKFTIMGVKSGDALAITSTSQQRGIIVQPGASNNYIITGNDLDGNNLTGLTDGGTGTNKVVAGNLGHVTRNGGTGTVAIGTSTVAITHGLAGTPNAWDINITPTTLMTAAGINAYVITSVGATTFNLTTDTNAVGSAFTFVWNSRIKGA